MNKLFSKIMLGIAAALTVVAPMAAAQDVRLESQLNVANVTGGVTPSYHKTVNAKVDDVVRLQAWYHNMENADSGKVANNLKVKMNVPTAPGKTQTVASTVSADNANTVNDTATVNLSIDTAYLEVIPGTAKWRHNTGTNDQPNWVTQSLTQAQQNQLLTTGLVLENEKPCFNFEATVTVEVRVKANAVTITKKGRVLNSGAAWATDFNAKAGDTLEYMITFKNAGNTTLTDVIVGDNLPGHTTYVKGSTKLINSNNPNGLHIDNDNVANGGINVGSYAPGAGGYVIFQVKIDSQLACGNYTMTNVGLVRPKGMNEFQNVAITHVNVVCAQTPPPTTPAPTQPLPATGAEAPLAGVMGSGVMGYAVRAYRRSKRGLSAALRGINR